MLNTQGLFLWQVAVDTAHSFKKTWKFWLGLSAKFLGIFMMTVLLWAMSAFILGAVLCYSKGILTTDSGFEAIQKLHGALFVFYCSFVALTGLSVWFVTLQWCFVFVGNSLDIVQNKTPRGFVYMKNIISYAPVMILLSLAVCAKYQGNVYGSWALYLAYVLVIKSYVFGARLCVSIYAFVDQRCTVRQSLVNSWHLTAKNRNAMISFALLLFSYHCLLIEFPAVAMVIGFLSLLLFSLPVLFYAHLYVALKNRRNT